MNRQERRRIAKEMYQHVKGVDNTVTVFYTSKDFDDRGGSQGGVSFILDRDSLRLKNEEVIPTNLNDFERLTNDILGWAEVASNHKPIRVSMVLAEAKLDETGADIDYTFYSLNDSGIKEDFRLEEDGVLKDMLNMMILNGGNSI